MSPSSPIEALPAELLYNIFNYLDNSTLKKLRLTSPTFKNQAARALFWGITLEPTIASATQLRHIINNDLHNHVRRVRFDLGALWHDIGTSDPSELCQYRENRRHRPYRIAVTDADYEQVTEYGELHFATHQFTENVPRLLLVEHITVVFDHGFRSANQLGIFDPTVVFFQVLSLARRLPLPIRSFSVGTHMISRLTFELFNRNLFSYRSWRPTMTSARPPLSYVAIASLEVAHCFKVWETIQDFEIELYDRESSHAEEALPYAFKDVLRRMSRTLRGLSITVVTPGFRCDHGWKRNCCMAHIEHYRKELSCGQILGDLNFESLRELSLRNVRCSPRRIGDFLFRHRNTLQVAKTADWVCDRWVPPSYYLKLLRDAAGDTLHLLTMAYCGDVHEELCKEQVCTEITNHCGVEMEKCYYEIRADILADMVLDRGISENAILLAIGYTITIEPFWIAGTELHESYLLRMRGVSAYHYAIKNREFPHHLDCIAQLDVEELCHRGQTRESILHEYCALTPTPWPCQHFYEDVRSGRPCRGPGNTFVLVINGRPGLYRWRFDHVEHFSFALFEPLTASKVVDHDTRHFRCWVRSPEAEYLDILLRVKSYSGCKWVFHSSAITASDIKNSFRPANLQQTIDTFEFQIDGLDEKRERYAREKEHQGKLLIESIEKKNEDNAREEQGEKEREEQGEKESEAKRAEWARIDEERPSSRQLRRSNKHWEWVLSRKQRR